MGKKSQKKDEWIIARERHEERVQWHRDELPGNGLDEIGELIEAYGLTIESYHAAALKNDEARMRDAVARAEACIANAWGCPPGNKYGGPRDVFDCWSSAADWLAKQTAADDGKVPMYGQRGRFLMTIAGCRVDFGYDGLFGICGGDANVVDLDRPFISETGYRSFQVCPMDRVIWTGGLPVDEYLRRVCENQLLQAGDRKLREPSLVMVDDTIIGKHLPMKKHDWIRQNRKKDSAWQAGGFLASLPGLTETGLAIREERGGQLAMMF